MQNSRNCYSSKKDTLGGLMPSHLLRLLVQSAYAIRPHQINLHCSSSNNGSLDLQEQFLFYCKSIRTILAYEGGSLASNNLSLMCLILKIKTNALELRIKCRKKKVIIVIDLQIWYVSSATKSWRKWLMIIFFITYLFSCLTFRSDYSNLRWTPSELLLEGYGISVLIV